MLTVLFCCFLFPNITFNHSILLPFSSSCKIDECYYREYKCSLSELQFCSAAFSLMQLFPPNWVKTHSPICYTMSFSACNVMGQP